MARYASAWSHFKYKEPNQSGPSCLLAKSSTNRRAAIQVILRWHCDQMRLDFLYVSEYGPTAAGASQRAHTRSPTGVGRNDAAANRCRARRAVEREAGHIAIEGASAAAGMSSRQRMRRPWTSSRSPETSSEDRTDVDKSVGRRHYCGHTMGGSASTFRLPQSDSKDEQMSMQEGVRRIVRTVSIIAWVCLLLGVLGAFIKARDVSMLIGMALFGLFAFIVLQGIAWIIAGFSGNAREQDGLVRWRDMPFHRRRAQARAAESGPAGVNGWLLFLVITLLVLYPLSNIALTMSSLHDAEATYPALINSPAWQAYKVAGWTIVLICCAISAYAGYRLRNVHKPSSVSIAKSSILFIGPGCVVLIVLDAVLVLHSPLSNVIASIGAKTFTQVTGFTVIWLLYLQWSRRVHNTYFRGVYQVAPSQPAVERQEPNL